MSFEPTVTVSDESIAASVAKMRASESKPTAFRLVAELESTLSEVCLSKGLTFSVIGGEVFGETMESYEFVVTRRFTKDGETYIGGASGELACLSDFTRRLRQAIDKTA